MDNCNNKLIGQFTRFGSNDTTNCQLKIDKETFNRYKNTLTQKQVYANFANRRVNNLSVCIPEPEQSDSESESSVSSGDSPPDTPTTITTSPPDSPIPPDNDILLTNNNRITQLVYKFHPDQIPDKVDEPNYPSCSYKPIKY